MHVVIMFVNIGTYHRARLRGAHVACASRGWTLTAVQLTDDHLDHPWGELAEERAYEVVTLMPAGDAPATRAFVNSREAGRAFRMRLDALRPDVVLLPGWYLPAMRAALSWCRANGAAAVLMSESKEDDAPRSWWRERYKRWLLGRFAAAIVGGMPHRQYLRRLGVPDDVIGTGYDIVDNGFFAHGATEARSDAAAWRDRLDLPARYFLASSRFIAKKNLVTLLEAYATYRDGAGAGARQLVLIGDGELRAPLEATARRLGLGRDLRMPGFQSYDRLPVYYGLADAFVHASAVEQWGLVVNEAMAASLPVIVSDRCGCAPDLVRPGRNGFTFAPDDAEALAAHLHAVVSSEDERVRMGRESERIISAWSPSLFGAAVLAAVDAASVRTAR